MKSNKLLNLHGTVFQAKTIAPKLTKELLALEQKLYDLNDTGTKLEKIALFSTDMPFLFNPETWNQQIMIEILTFFHEADFITEEQIELMLDEGDDSVFFFQRYAKEVAASDVEPTMIDCAFGGQFFPLFDYTNKIDERAQNFIDIYRELPIYEVKDVTRRNILIKKIAKMCLGKLKIKNTQIVCKCFLTEDPSDPSNSPLVIHFWTSEKAIIAIKAYYAV